MTSLLADFFVYVLFNMILFLVGYAVGHREAKKKFDNGIRVYKVPEIDRYG